MRPGAPLSPGLVSKTRDPEMRFTSAVRVSADFFRARPPHSAPGRAALTGCLAGTRWLARRTGHRPEDDLAEPGGARDGDGLPIRGGGDPPQRTQVARPAEHDRHDPDRAPGVVEHLEVAYQ